MKMLFVWTGVTSYMADCWRELQKLDGVELKVVVERVDSGREFAVASVLAGIDFELVEKGGVAKLGFLGGWRPDAVFAGGWRSANTRAVLAAFPDVPKVFCLDMPWRWSLRCFVARFVLRGFLRQFGRIWVPGELSARYARWLGFSRDRIVRRLYAVRYGRFLPSSAVRRGFLYVGRFAPEKRLDLLYAAYGRYRRMGGSWPLDLYGAGEVPGPCDGICVHGFLQPDELPRIYAGHACLVMASSFDPWPLVILESRAAGLEVIASDRCGNADELHARKVPFGDVEAMARTMLEVECSGAMPEKPSHDYDCRAWAERALSLANELRIGYCPGLADIANGMAVVARLLARERPGIVHGAWLPSVWRAAMRPHCIRMTHGAFSPVYLRRQGRIRKLLAGPVERFLLRRAEEVLATCETEARWIRDYEPEANVKVVDIRKYFRIDAATAGSGGRHVLYLGRRHPLKGVGYLERAVAGTRLELRIETALSGGEKEAAWAWCDVLCLPTLSENFGLVVAEALERGKRVVTTDGAPAWKGQSGVTYLEGFVDADEETKVRMLRDALVA